MKLASLLLMVTFLAGCTSQTVPSADTNHPDKNATVVINNQKLSVGLADSDAEQIQGLSGTDSIPDDGLLFSFSEQGRWPIWMKDMRYPIDIVWIADLKVVDVVHEAQPQPGVPDQQLTVYTPRAAADFVLEIASGRAKQLRLNPGTTLESLTLPQP